MELQSFAVRRRTSLALSAFALLVFLAQSVGAGEREDIAIVLDKYVKAIYARDFRSAYEQISSADQRLKDVHSYSRERGEYRDFALEAARSVAQSVNIRLTEPRIDQERAAVKVNVNVPDATKLSPLMLQ